MSNLTVFYTLMYLQGLVAFGVALYATVCWLTDRSDMVSRYVLRAGTAYYMWLFFCGCCVGLTT